MHVLALAAARRELAEILTMLHRFDTHGYPCREALDVELWAMDRRTTLRALIGELEKQEARRTASP